VGWVLGYGILRPIIEVLRDDDQRGNVGPLSTSQFIGAVSVILGLTLLWHLVKKYRQDPEGSRLWLRPIPAADGPSVYEEPTRVGGGGGGSGRGRKKRR